MTDVVDEDESSFVDDRIKTNEDWAISCCGDHIDDCDVALFYQRWKKFNPATLEVVDVDVTIVDEGRTQWQVHGLNFVVSVGMISCEF